MPRQTIVWVASDRRPKEEQLMIAVDDVRRIWRLPERVDGPVLSLYVNTPPAGRGNSARAIALRVRGALERLDVPPEVARKVLNLFEEQVPRSRSRAVFASADWMQHFDLRVDLPLASPQDDGVEAHWGPVCLTPLLLVLDEHERHGVVFVDSEHFRFFEVFLGEIEEITDAFRAIDPEQWRRLEESKPGTPLGVPARGGSGRELFARRVDEWTLRFYRYVARILDEQVWKRRIEHLILLGPADDVAAFEAQLPRSLRERVVARGPGLTTPHAPAAEVLERVEPLIEEARQRDIDELIERAAEHGVRGVADSLDALQRGQLHVLVVPWSLDAVAWRCRSTGHLAPTREGAVKLCGQDDAEKVSLRRAVAEMAAAYGTRIAFAHGDPAERRLVEEFGGMVGLRRW